MEITEDSVRNPESLDAILLVKEEAEKDLESLSYKNYKKLYDKYIFAIPIEVKKIKDIVISISLFLLVIYFLYAFDRGSTFQTVVVYLALLSSSFLVFKSCYLYFMYKQYRTLGNTAKMIVDVLNEINKSIEYLEWDKELKGCE